MYTYRFLDDLVLLYPVYTLLFSHTGMSVAQISSLFVIWSMSSLLLEVPSGAWADATSRRRLLILGPLLTAVAFGLWAGAPSYGVFALGFALWGLKGALTSGALEALMYEELQRLDAHDRYATVMGRGEVAGVLAATCSGLLAAPVLAAGGYPAVGAASAAVCLVAAAVARLFPENRNESSTADDEPGWAQTLRSGVTEVRRSRAVLAAVGFVAATASIWGALDEYTPLLIDSTGVSAAQTSLLMVVIWTGAAVGGLLAGRGAHLGPGPLAVLFCCGAVLLAAGALCGQPVGVLPLAAAFAIFQLTTVVADVRLQERIQGGARATVTSLAGMATDVGTMAVYAGYAALADIGGHGGAFAVLALPYVLIALWLLTSRPLT